MVFRVYCTQTDVVSFSWDYVEVELNVAGSTWCLVPKGTANFHLFFIEDYSESRASMLNESSEIPGCVSLFLGVLAIHVGSQSSTAVF